MSKCSVRIMTVILMIAVILSVASNAMAELTLGVCKAPAATKAPSYGRLVISDVDIDVGLYNGSTQAVVDAWDSACMYHPKKTSGMVIVDHSTQGFKNLTNVVPGTIGQIVREDGSVVYIECVAVCDGRNNKRSITDADGKNALGNHDFVTYTCLDETAVPVRICQWNVVGADIVDPAYDSQFKLDQRTQDHIIAMSTGSLLAKN